MRLYFVIFALLCAQSLAVRGQSSTQTKNPYQELSLGAIKPKGWLKEMLVRQKTGSS